MRLVKTSSLELQEFYPSQVPPYAIVSHTWGPDEVTFADMAVPERARRMPRFSKIRESCRLAERHGLRYVWLDTCCIDKSSSAELTESINSMFQWYRDAEVCYVYLEDLRPADSGGKGGPAPSSLPGGSAFPVVDRLSDSRWFTRGWTLQELLAPRELQFYDGAWAYQGSKLEHVDAVAARTGIPYKVLRGETALGSCSLARRMSWAARRQTTRLEDMAYCLLGIFDVNMPLVYGEGLRAFRRLQEEIVRRTNDLTILAWRAPIIAPSQPQQKQLPPSAAPSAAASAAATSQAGDDEDQFPVIVRNGQEPLFASLFAPFPAAFAESAGLLPFQDDFESFSVTNRGLYVSGDTYLRIFKGPDPRAAPPRPRTTERYLLLVGTGGSGHYAGLYLRKIGPNLFQRDWASPLALVDANVAVRLKGFSQTDWYILTDVSQLNRVTPATFRHAALHVPFAEEPDGGAGGTPDAGGGDVSSLFRLIDTTPVSLWDVRDRVFLRPKPYRWTRYNMVIAMKFIVSASALFSSAPDDSSAKGNGKGKGTQEKKEREKPTSLVVLCDYRSESQGPLFRLFEEERYAREAAMIFARRARADAVLWADLELQLPQIAGLRDFVELRRRSSASSSAAASTSSSASASDSTSGEKDKGKKIERSEDEEVIRVSVSARKGVVEAVSKEVELYSLQFDVRRVVAPRPAPAPAPRRERLSIGRAPSGRSKSAGAAADTGADGGRGGSGGGQLPVREKSSSIL